MHFINYLVVVWLSEFFVCSFVFDGFFQGIIKFFLAGRTILTKKSKHIFPSLDLTAIQNVVEICERKSPWKLKRNMNANARRNSHSLHMPHHTQSLVYVIKNSVKHLDRF